MRAIVTEWIGTVALFLRADRSLIRLRLLRAATGEIFMAVNADRGPVGIGVAHQRAYIREPLITKGKSPWRIN
jgi:hypothetical protein